MTSRALIGGSSARAASGARARRGRVREGGRSMGGAGEAGGGGWDWGGWGCAYWKYADCGEWCGRKWRDSEPTTIEPSDAATSPCCQEPSRTSRISLPLGQGCCDDLPTKPTPEVLAIQPRELR